MKRLGISFSVLFVLLLVAFAIAIGSTSAQITALEIKIRPTDNADNQEGNNFGTALSIFNNTMVVGVRYGDSLEGSMPITNTGAAYVYLWDGIDWSEHQKVVASDGAELDQFGIAVDIDNDLMVIGANLADINGNSNAGAAYIYRLVGASWVEEAKITAVNGKALNRFGSSVAISNGIVVVGSPQYDDNLNVDSGTVYVYEQDNGIWQEIAMLSPIGASSGDYFGISVSIDDDTILAGSYGDNVYGPLSGSAYIFRSNGSSWIQEQKLSPSPTQGSLHDQFGQAVAIDGDIAVVRSHLDDTIGNAAGAAYVFRRNGNSWIQEQQLTAVNGEPLDQFGWSIDIVDEMIIVGTFAFDESTGAVYIFVWNGSSWIQEQQLTSPDLEKGDAFGYAVAASDNHFAVGAIYDEGDDNGASGVDNSGAAYIYEREMSPLPDDIFHPADQWMSYRASTAVALGDLNGDGLVDAIVGNRGATIPTGYNRVWINQGNGVFIDIGERLSSSGYEIELGDLDLDGDLDAIIVLGDPGNQRLSLWKNNGDGRFEASTDIGAQSSLDDIALGDIDLDGDLDLVVASFSTGLGSSVWLNDGNANFTKDTNQFDSTTLRSTNLVLADFDNDGDLDAIFASNNGTTAMWRNDAGKFSTEMQMFGTKQDVAADDLNQDGYIDIYFANNEVWFNDGNGGFIMSAQNLPSTVASQIELADIDNDGDSDALITVHNSNGNVWLNNGYGYFLPTGEEFSDQYLYGLPIFDVADIDNDNDLDVFSVYDALSSFIGSPNKVWLNQTNTPIACEIGSGFAEINGEVVINAVNYSRYTPGTGNTAAMLWGWYDGATPPQSALQVLPDSGNSTGLTPNGPKLSYIVQFESAGDYYVFVRGKAPSVNAGSGDSVHVGLNGVPVTTNTGYGLMGFKTYFTWQNLSNHDANLNGQVTLITIPTAGQYTFNVWPREDGFILDRIMLEKVDPNNAPSISNNDTQEGSVQTLCPSP